MWSLMTVAAFLTHHVMYIPMMEGKAVPIMDQAASTSFFSLLCSWAFTFLNQAMMPIVIMLLCPSPAKLWQSIGPYAQPPQTSEEAAEPEEVEIPVSYLGNCISALGLGQIRDVYIQELEAVDAFHHCPANEDRCMSLQLSLPFIFVSIFVELGHF